MLEVRDDKAAAFEELMVRYQNRLVTVLEHLVGRHDLAEDLAQDVFLRVYRARKRYVPGAKFSTWLFTIARNKCRNVRKQRRPAVLDRLPEAAKDCSPDGELNEAEWFHQLDEALAALPFEQKVAFVLSEIQELPLEEIAQMEGVPLGTIKSRISRAKDKLRSLLRPTAEQP